MTRIEISVVSGETRHTQIADLDGSVVSESVLSLVQVLLSEWSSALQDASKEGTVRSNRMKSFLRAVDKMGSDLSDIRADEDSLNADALAAKVRHK